MKTLREILVNFTWSSLDSNQKINFIKDKTIYNIDSVCDTCYKYYTYDDRYCMSSNKCHSCCDHKCDCCNVCSKRFRFIDNVLYICELCNFKSCERFQNNIEYYDNFPCGRHHIICDSCNTLNICSQFSSIDTQNPLKLCYECYKNGCKFAETTRCKMCVYKFLKNKTKIK